MNGIFLILIAGSVVAAAFAGAMPAVTQAGIDQAKFAVTFAIGLIGQMALWLGFMNVLREAGVYVRFEECKGREPIVRPGLEITVADHDFDNPLTSASMMSSTGGTRGKPTRVGIDLEHIAESAAPT